MSTKSKTDSEFSRVCASRVVRFSFPMDQHIVKASVFSLTLLLASHRKFQCRDRDGLCEVLTARAVLLEKYHINWEKRTVVWSAFYFSGASPRTELTVNRKPSKLTGEPVLQKSVEQLVVLQHPRLVVLSQSRPLTGWLTSWRAWKTFTRRNTQYRMKVLL